MDLTKENIATILYLVRTYTVSAQNPKRAEQVLELNRKLCQAAKIDPYDSKAIQAFIKDGLGIEPM